MSALLILSACNKYVDGPAFSLLSKKSRLCNDWKLESAYYNDVDFTADFLAIMGSDYRVHIEKDETYRIDGNNADQGTWEFGGDKDDVYLQSSMGYPEQSFRILRLKSKELWMKQTQTNGDVLEIHLQED